MIAQMDFAWFCEYLWSLGLFDTRKETVLVLRSDEFPHRGPMAC